MVTSIFSYGTYKLLASSVAVLVAYLIGTNNVANFTLLIWLICFDFVTAIMAKYKIGEPIESRKVMKTAFKMVVYGILVSAAFMTETIGMGTTVLDCGVLFYLALTELVSIIENAGKMGFSMPQRVLNNLQELKK